MPSLLLQYTLKLMSDTSRTYSAFHHMQTALATIAIAITIALHRITAAVPWSLPQLFWSDIETHIQQPGSCIVIDLIATTQLRLVALRISLLHIVTSVSLHTSITHTHTCIHTSTRARTYTHTTHNLTHTCTHTNKHT